MNHEFSIDFFSHEDYEFLAVEIHFRKQRLCQLFRRKDDSIEIEFVEDLYLLDKPVRMIFPLQKFLEIIETAQKELLALTGVSGP